MSKGSIGKGSPLVLIAVYGLRALSLILIDLYNL
jgi:hypothetical protein